MWVRYEAVGFVCNAVTQLDEVDIECYLAPIVQPFVKYPVYQLKDEVYAFI